MTPYLIRPSVGVAVLSYKLVVSAASQVQSTT